MIDFYHESEPVHLCPGCFNLLVLDDDFPDLVVYRCDRCVKHFSPTDLNRLVEEQKRRVPPWDIYGWFAFVLVFACWPALLFLIIMLLFWIF